MLLARRSGVWPRNSSSFNDEISADLPATEASLSKATPDQTAELELTIHNQHGLHARPAAAMVQAASRFSSSVEVSNLTAGRGPVSARSLTSLALLQIRKGDRIKVACSGDDCRDALRAIGELASAGFGESATGTSAVTPEKVTPKAGASGFPGSDGIAIGPLAMLQTEDLSEDNEPAGAPATELAKLKAAMKSVNDTLRRDRVQDGTGGSGGGAILEAQALILADPTVLTKLQVARGEQVGTPLRKPGLR